MITTTGKKYIIGGVDKQIYFKFQEKTLEEKMKLPRALIEAMEFWMKKEK